MELIRPEFCTTVLPEEYDYIEQFNESMKAANKFHSKFTTDEKCPPPYFPIDMGKVYGLLHRIAELEARLGGLEKLYEQIAEVNELLWEFTENPNLELGEKGHSKIEEYFKKYSSNTHP